MYLEYPFDACSVTHNNNVAVADAKPHDRHGCLNHFFHHLP